MSLAGQGQGMNEIGTAIEDAGEHSSHKTVKSAVAHALLGALQSECAAYCILSGYDELPESFDTDIDFMVSSAEFARIPGLIAGVARQTGTRLFHTVGHELSARSYSLGFQAGEELIIVQPDSSADYRHFGLLWLRADEVLAARRLHPRGFWIPAAAHEFVYYLVKRLNKRFLDGGHGAKLHRLYLEDSEGCDRMIERFWKGRNRIILARMAQSNDWSQMEASLESIRSEMKQNSAESLGERIRTSPKHILHHFRRSVRPTGGWIAIMGPDGAGKSAVIEAVQKQFRFAYNKVKCFHLRPKTLRGNNGAHVIVTDPHGRPPRGWWMSVIKVFFLIADYWIGYALVIAPAMRRSQLIVFDRYVYDLLVDSKRVRYGGPAWLLRLAARVVPHPDLVILLDAAPDVLWSRKQEVPFNEVMRQRDAYCKVAQALPFARIVNAAQSLPDVIRDVDAVIVEHYERRTAERLGLNTPSVPVEPKPVISASRQCR
jgi:thymidylate kinase